MSTSLQLTLANPRGFCAGVVRAVDIVRQALVIHGAPVYVFHEIVHNRHVVNELRAAGTVFVDDLDAVPDGAVVVFSAHGVSKTVEVHAWARGLEVIDATCPLVTKVQRQARWYSERGYAIVIIGHAGHDEVVGTVGRVVGPAYVVATPDEVHALVVTDPTRLAYVTQTTLSMDDSREVIAALKQRFPSIQGTELDGICYATQNRQRAVRELAKQVDLILVVGAHNSSNANRLREVAAARDIPTYLIEDAGALDPRWFTQNQRVGITAGASTPEHLVQGVVDVLRVLGVSDVREMVSLAEATRFRLPDLAPRNKRRTGS